MKYNAFIISLFVILVLAVSCSSTGRFGISQRYSMEKNEFERPLDKFVVEKYESIINIDTLNVPLNKFITTNNYRVYIGVSFNANANTLLNFYKNDTLFTFYKNNITTDTISAFFKVKNNYYYSLLYNCPKDKFTYVLTLESDSMVADEKFKNSFLLNKIRNVN